jgi:hypothetical protein
MSGATPVCLHGAHPASVLLFLVRQMMDQPVVTSSRFGFGSISSCLLCGVLTNTLYAIYPWGEVSSRRDRSFGGSEVWKSPCGPIGSYKMIDLNSMCLRHAIRNFLHTLKILLYRPTRFVIRAL